MIQPVSLLWTIAVSFLVWNARSTVIVKLKKDFVYGKKGWIYCGVENIPSTINLHSITLEAPLGTALYTWIRGQRDFNQLFKYGFQYRSVYEGKDTVYINATAENVDCSYEKKYCCEVQYRYNWQLIWGGLSEKKVYTVEVTVPWDRPYLTSITPSTILATQTVEEGSTVEITFRMNLGHSDKRVVQWRLYRGDKLEIIPANDSRINTTLESKESCLENITSVFTFSPTRADTDFDLRVFVFDKNNVRMPTGSDADNCDTMLLKKFQLCDATPTVMVVYPLSQDAMSVAIQPKRPFKLGDRVVLVCKCDGLPKPNMTWTFVTPEGERVVQKIYSAHEFHAVLPSLLPSDIGKYRCTAIHTFHGQEYTASKDITLSLDMYRDNGWHLSMESWIFLLVLAAGVLVLAIWGLTRLLTKTAIPVEEETTEHTSPTRVTQTSRSSTTTASYATSKSVRFA